MSDNRNNINSGDYNLTGRPTEFLKLTGISLFKDLVVSTNETCDFCSGAVNTAGGQKRRKVPRMENPSKLWLKPWN